ncbi:MAG: hypothetical protein HYU67_07955 [Flavobacteriia bacterium]|nr:hypothetical protein [Flavobacteriia bacterium]
MSNFLLLSQESNFRSKILDKNQKNQLLDSFTVYPNTLNVFCGQQELDKNSYLFDYDKNTISFFTDCEDSLKVTYRVLPLNLSKRYQHRDTTILFDEKKGDREKFLIRNNETYEDIFGSSGIKKSGSISRGISFGNNQDLSVNSSLNLELSGNITSDLKVLASVTDDNLPIQPEGNTNKIQEFDQVFIQVYNDNLKLIAGDFWIYKPKGYFMNYKKRAQGLSLDYQWLNVNNKQWKTQLSGAFSKGKFQRQIIQGVEGNQGPYRLNGAENEPYIIILSGTERVFIDGMLLERGQEYDYMIDYNTAELIFTVKRLINKDSRIVVEFQYSDQNYARSLLQSSTQYTGKRFSYWLNAYSEQDAKNQSIQQDLTIEQKKLMSEIGDSLHLALSNSIVKIGYNEVENLYKLVDTLGIDSVLVFSVNQDSALYRATFSYVGKNKGNYILANSNAYGKIYQWLAPINGVPQGEYEPARKIISPKKKQMVSSGFSYQINPIWKIESEFAYTKNDQNTFSRKDSKDDEGYSNRSVIYSNKPYSKIDSTFRWEFKTKTEIEILNKYFSPIEQYRSVEFDRDWNTRNKNYQGDQISSAISFENKHYKNGKIGVSLAQYSIGKDYDGYKTSLYGDWNKNGFFSNWLASYLSSNNIEKNQFQRHKVSVAQNIKKIKLAYKDDFEKNTFRLDTLLKTTSYLFYDYEFSLSNADSSKINYKTFYRERIDQRSDSHRLKKAAKAKSTGIELMFNLIKGQKLNLLIHYRELKINDQSLISQTPENTLLGRIDFDQNFFKNSISLNTFYEVGSGLELKREFQYIKVADGQGVYTWNDYNYDGNKDLNEFEIAQYVDQASYIRVFTPSNEYVKTYFNEFNQGVFFKPERIWRNKNSLLKYLSYLSNQSRIRINRKVSDFLPDEVFNPFVNRVRDTTLISSSTSVRNTFYVNRTGSVFTSDWTYQNNLSKSLLASGFDSRIHEYHENNLRLTLFKKFSIENQIQTGRKVSEADYTTGRNYAIKYSWIKPMLSYQPNTVLRISVHYKYSDKKNISGEHGIINEYGFQGKFNQAEKGSFQGNFSFIKIAYNATDNSALGFEILEALKVGENYTWTASYQRSVSKSLQISIQYNGRKSQSSKIIHSGGMEVRAFF